MNKQIALVIIVVISAMFCACATAKKDTATLPSVKFAEATLTKRLYVKAETAVPIEPTLTFTTDDNEAISYVKLRNLAGEHKLRWDWINPKGEIYTSSGDYTLSASHSQGEWQIRVYLDGSLIIQKGFTITNEKADGVH